MTTETSSRRAAIYARISETVAHRDKVADQLEQCRRLADRRGYMVIAEFADDGIGALGDKTRPRFEALLDAALRGEFDIILATEEERLARNVPEKAELQAACMEAGVVWETDRDGFVDPATEAGEFFSTMRAAMGRMESRRKASRQRAANADRAARGEPNPGRRRYGYERDGMTPREPEAAVVRRIFEHIASGGSVRGIALDLEREGVAPGTAKNWRPARIREIGANPHYAGAMRYKGEVIPSAHIKPIVDSELAEEVRAILADPTRRTSPGTAPRHLLSNIAACGSEGCEARMVYMRSYVCTRDTAHAQIAKHVVEPRVLEAVALAFLTMGRNLIPAPERATIAHLVEAHSRNEQAVAATIADRNEQLITPTVARGELARLKVERVAIEADLERARLASGALTPLVAVVNELLETDAEALPMADAHAAMEDLIERFTALPMEQQRDTVRSLLEVQVDPFYTTDADGRRQANRGQRIHIWHKIATHLNPDAVDPGEGNSGPRPDAALRKVPRALRASS
ncbi:recombinase family protein [Agromyces sp. CCNWLW203]|uniref:recombinase family protein n=1 Tax=Agromyces sp. CCNWLW203 TaxID=3112842 RepID=UPI002F967CBB